jgi:hypothetical protein
MQYQTGAKSDTMISYLYITLIFMKVWWTAAKNWPNLEANA